MKILVVDDSGFSRTVIAGLFAKLRPESIIEQASDASTALSKLEASDSPYSLITVDIHMPGMGGVELVDELQRRKITSQVTFLTANVQDSMRERAAERGVRFVAKPVNAQKLAGLLEEVGL